MRINSRLQINHSLSLRWFVVCFHPYSDLKIEHCYNEYRTNFNQSRLQNSVSIAFFRHYTTPQHFNASKLASLNYAGGESSYQPLPKERPELALHVNQNQQHQQDQQLQIQVQLQQQKQQTGASPHQQLAVPGLGRLPPTLLPESNSKPLRLKNWTSWRKISRKLTNP